MVVWRSRPRHPPEKEKLGSFASRSCNDGKKKCEMHVQNRCFANLTLLLFCRSSCCPYICMFGSMATTRTKNPFKPILPVTMLL